MKRAIIFGGNGFLGSFLVKELCELNYEILIISRSEKGIKNLKTLGFPGQISFKNFDVSKSSSLEEFDFTKFNLVVNLVGIGVESRSNSYHGIHVEFASRLASVTKKAGNVLVHISAFLPENTNNFRYAITKKEGEKLVMQNNQRAIIIKPTVMIGQGGSFIQTFEKIINSLPFFPMPFNRKAKIQPVFAGDVAKFIAKACEMPDLYGKEFILAGSEVLFIKDFIERIFGFMNKRRKIFPVPFFIVFLGMKLKELLPNFMFRSNLTADILSLSKLEVLTEKSDIKLLIKKPKTVDEVLSEVLAKYKLYD